MSTAPKAFLSHASEDKERFVLDFAAKLRAKGIEAWLDRWEIRPGDSLIDKIFEDGIKNAEAFIVVISSVSITKKWVREELDSAMVRRIEKSCRLIPVVIDDCEVPQTLAHLKWVKVKDLSNYDAELSEIVSALLGASEKPPIGSPPAHFIATVIDYLPDLTKADNLVFGILCRYYLKQGDKFFGVKEVDGELMTLGLSDVEVAESLEILARRGYIETKTIDSGQIWGIGLHPFSLDAFMRAEVGDYDRQVSAIVSKIVNEDCDTSSALNESTGSSVPIVLHILDLLQSRGLLEITGPGGFPFRKILSVSPELKRMLRQQSR